MRFSIFGLIQYLTLELSSARRWTRVTRAPVQWSSSAAIAAELLSLRTSAVQLEVSGTDSVAQIIATRIATLRKDIETALATLEGIDGQTETAFGLRFLNEMGLKDKDLWRTRSNLAAVLTSYKAAVQFDTPEGCEAALGLVSKQLTD